jgi:gamma-glutamylcyclotransferase (GGCT)/AIG2-like uncharacterized protein YtfP
MDVQYLFVYGTLRSDVGHQMHGVLAAGARLLGAATVHGELYAIGRFVALGSADAAHLVKGEVYEVKEDAIDRLLAMLDEYEGISDPRQDDYRRDVVTATLGDGRAVRAWAYVLNRSSDGLRRIPSGDYKDSAPKCSA